MFKRSNAITPYPLYLTGAVAKFGLHTFRNDARAPLMKLTFCGAARTVTGSKHLLELENGKKLLLDCGLYQGRRAEADHLNRHFPFDPTEIDAVLLSHAHIDHSGLLPKLWKEGFRGHIYATHATVSLCGLMLLDSAYIQEKDVAYVNKIHRKRGKPPVEPLYTVDDAEGVLDHFVGVSYGLPFSPVEGVRVVYRDAGHILGSASVLLEVEQGGQAVGRRLAALEIACDRLGVEEAGGALLEARRSGRGQVVDAAMVDGTISLLTPYYAMAARGLHTAERGTNLFDGGSPYYNVYETRDGRYVSIAPIEPHFYAVLVEKLGLDPATLPDREDRAHWPALRERFAEVFRTRTRDEWCALLEGTDACFAPVLSFDEAPRHAHHIERGVFREEGGLPAPVPSPRLSRTPGEPGPGPAWPGADTDQVLRAWGFASDEIATLRERGAIR